MSDFMNRIDRLANLVPGGQLASVMGPEKFMDHVIEYVEKLQLSNKRAMNALHNANHWLIELPSLTYDSRIEHAADFIRSVLKDKTRVE